MKYHARQALSKLRFVPLCDTAIDIAAPVSVSVPAIFATLAQDSDAVQQICEHLAADPCPQCRAILQQETCPLVLTQAWLLLSCARKASGARRLFSAARCVCEVVFAVAYGGGKDFEPCSPRQI